MKVSRLAADFVARHRTSSHHGDGNMYYAGDKLGG
jgi:hypothetical protein